jgi:hypothetical protein
LADLENVGLSINTHTFTITGLKSFRTRRKLPISLPHVRRLIYLLDQALNHHAEVDRENVEQLPKPRDVIFGISSMVATT